MNNEKMPKKPKIDDLLVAVVTDSPYSARAPVFQFEDIQAICDFIPVIGPANPSSTIPSGRQLRLPEPVSASALQSMILNSPTAFDLVDIHPPEHFSDYHIRGAINVAVADVLSSARVAGSFDVSLTFITISPTHE